MRSVSLLTLEKQALSWETEKRCQMGEEKEGKTKLTLPILP